MFIGDSAAEQGSKQEDSRGVSQNKAANILKPCRPLPRQVFGSDCHGESMANHAFLGPRAHLEALPSTKAKGALTTFVPPASARAGPAPRAQPYRPSAKFGGKCQDAPQDL